MPHDLNTSARVGTCAEEVGVMAAGAKTQENVRRVDTELLLEGGAEGLF